MVKTIHRSEKTCLPLNLDVLYYDYDNILRQTKSAKTFSWPCPRPSDHILRYNLKKKYKNKLATWWSPKIIFIRYCHNTNHKPSKTKYKRGHGSKRTNFPRINKQQFSELSHESKEIENSNSFIIVIVRLRIFPK